MTVIAWDGKTLAADSMEADDEGYYIGRCKKIFRLKSGGMLGTAGDSDSRALIALVENVKDENDLPTRAELEATKLDGVFILVLPDKAAVVIEIFQIEDRIRFFAQVLSITGKHYAIGHGGDFARAAMAMGKTAQEAVKLACKFSLFCGLPVQSMRLEDKPKEKIKRVRKPPAGEAE